MRQNWLIAALVLGIVAIVIAVIAMRLSDDGAESAGSLAAVHALHQER